MQGKCISDEVYLKKSIKNMSFGQNIENKFKEIMCYHLTHFDGKFLYSSIFQYQANLISQVIRIHRFKLFLNL